MKQTDKAFTSAIAEIYEDDLVPLLFRPYAVDMAELVKKCDPKSILETAAGTGIVTRTLLETLPSAVITATDLNPGMLEVAKSKISSNRVSFQQADALSLPFAENSYDAVVCQFGAMFFPDKVKGFKEALRVLKPDGHFFFSVWDHIRANAFAQTVEEALAKIFPNDPPTFMSRTPHGYSDSAKISAELKSAGFSHVAFDTIERISEAPSPEYVAKAYCQGTPFRNEIEARSDSLSAVTIEVTNALQKQYGSGKISGPIRAILVVAKR